MKILHTSDWHLGKTLCKHSLIEDQQYFIENNFFPTIEREKPDIIIIAGDVFDRAVAPIEAINIFNNVLYKVSHDYSTPLVIISGNHDSRERMAVGAELLKDQNIYISNSIDSFFKPITIKKDSEKINIYTLPFFDYTEAAHYFGDESNISSLSDAFSCLTEKLKDNFDNNTFNILVSHCYINCCSLSGSESSIYIAQTEEVSYKLLDMFDYIALGHLHSAQKAGNKGYYSGSPLSYSFSEKSFNKSMILVETYGKSFDLSHIDISPLRKVRTLKGNFKDIIEIGKNHPSDDYICVHLSDNSPIYMPIEQLKVYFPNIITVSADWINNAAQNSDTLDEIPPLNLKLNEKDLFCQFIEQICGEDVSESDLKNFDCVLSRLKEDEE